MKTLTEQYKTELEKIRAKIPEQYNKALLLDYLLDPNYDLFSSITTRGDGKTYNYFSTIIKLTQKFSDFKFTVITRHFTLRGTMVDMLEKIIIEQKICKLDDIYFKVTPQYTMLYLKKQPVAVISDLNAVSDLKYASNVLKDFRLIIYDEFLALNGDYAPDEPQRLQTLYESIDRGTNSFLPNPKILLLGNPVNFDSPLLSYWSLFNMLEKQPMNSVITNGNIVQERFKNDNVNEKKNQKLFKDTNGSISGEFATNKLLIVPELLKSTMTSSIVIKLKDGYYLTVHYNEKAQFYVQIDGTPRNIYDYCFNLVDLPPKSRLIKDRDLREVNIRNYKNKKILFSDTFSINYIDNNSYIMYISISHLIARELNVQKHDPYLQAQSDTRHLEQAELKSLKTRLFNEYLGGY